MVSRHAWPAWPLPETCDELRKSANFSSGMPAYRSTVPNTPRPDER